MHLFDKLRAWYCMVQIGRQGNEKSADWSEKINQPEAEKTMVNEKAKPAEKALERGEEKEEKMKSVAEIL